jgi:integrase
VTTPPGSSTTGGNNHAGPDRPTPSHNYTIKGYEEGNGGYQKHPSKPGWTRGYRSIDGKRVYASWQATPVLAAAALKGLKPTASVKTVGAAIELILKYRVPKSSTAGNYVQSRDAYLKELLPVKASKLTNEAVSLHYKMLADRGLSKSTIHQAHAVLVGGLSWAHDNSWVGQNVARSIKLPPAPRAKIDAMSDVDRALMIAAMSGHRFEARFRLAIQWGLRPGEATGLRWRDVSFANERIKIVGQVQRSKIKVDGTNLGTIYVGSAKSETSTRSFRPGSTIMGLLAIWKAEQTAEHSAHILTAHQVRQRADQASRLKRAAKLGLLDDPNNYTVLPDDLVFTQPNTDPILPRLDATMWAGLCLAAGVEFKRLYSARHTTASFMLRNGATPLQVSQLLGHRDSAFTERTYADSLDVITDDLHLRFG